VSPVRKHIFPEGKVLFQSLSPNGLGKLLVADLTVGSVTRAVPGVETEIVDKTIKTVKYIAKKEMCLPRHRRIFCVSKLRLNIIQVLLTGKEAFNSPAFPPV